MEDFKRRRKIRQALYSRSVFIVLLIFTVLLAKGAWGVYLKKSESEKNLATVEAQLLESERRKQELTTAIDSLQTKEGLEREIRNKFSVAKEGEEVVIVVEDKNENNTKTDTSGSFIQKIGRWFKDLF